jgi:regulator of RNase E activity RraA
MSHIDGFSIYPHANNDSAHANALRGIASSIVSDVMGARLIGTSGLRPINRSSVQTCGHAFTVRVRAGDNLMLHKALTMLQPGDVLVVDGEGDTSRALMGEIMMTNAKKRGAIAFVIDGAIRDADAFEAHQFPCWARGVNLRGPYKDGPGSINVPVVVGGMLVHPGDIIAGDGDGLVCIPPSQVEDVAKLARAKVAQEHAAIASISAGTQSVAWIDETLRKKGVVL